MRSLMLMRVLLCGMMLVGMVPAQAQDEATKLPPRQQVANLKFGAFSNYCWSLGGATERPSLQSDVWVCWYQEGGISPYVGAWAATGQGDFGSEVDVYFGAMMPLGDNTNFDSAVLWYNLEPISSTRGDLGELAIRIDHTLSPQWSAEVGLRLMQPIGLGDMPVVPFTYVGATWQEKVSRKATLSLRQRLSYDAGVFGGDAGWITRHTARLDYNLGGNGPNYRLGALAEWSQPLIGIQDRTSQFVVGTELMLVWP